MWLTLCYAMIPGQALPTTIDDDVLLLITQRLHPLVAADICWSTRKAALGAWSCASIGELKLALAIDRCTCVKERLALVQLAMKNDVCLDIFDFHHF